MKCLVCGHTINDSFAGCPICGARIDDIEEDSLYQSFTGCYSFEHVVILTRISTGEIMEIKEFPSIVGRSSHCDFIVRGNPAIGRKHVEINISGDRVVVKDLMSKNHTFINGKMISEALILDAKNRMRIADEEFILEVRVR